MAQTTPETGRSFVPPEFSFYPLAHALRQSEAQLRRVAAASDSLEAQQVALTCAVYLAERFKKLWSSEWSMKFYLAQEENLR